MRDEEADQNFETDSFTPKQIFFSIFSSKRKKSKNVGCSLYRTNSHCEQHLSFNMLCGDYYRCETCNPKGIKFGFQLRNMIHIQGIHIGQFKKYVKLALSCIFRSMFEELLCESSVASLKLNIFYNPI